ncbi:NAD(+) diphosphatase [Cognatishimia sp. WU-CL00825]|uniref:NAD(+) diphosphatase n=1 Tax=Cognatishimia sp. WU-CL00825 TaxID=3127658 RepID=UPI00310415F6
MIDFETVTFGGAGLDRMNLLRSDAEAFDKALKAPDARSIVLWRGKPLVHGDSDKALVRLPLDHPIFATRAERPVLLGKDDGTVVFASDISGWDPESQELPDNGFLDKTQQQHPAVPASDAFIELRNIMADLSAMDAELAATARSVIEWHRLHRFCATCGAGTDIASGGWQRSCGACGRQHFPRIDPVVIMLITNGNRVLVGRGVDWPEDMYSLLAGFVEPGETPEAAVRREVFEEAGVQVGDVRYLGSQPWPYPSSLMMGCHGIATSSEITIDPAEIADAVWLTREEMMSCFEGTHPTIRPARKGSIAHFILQNWLADRLD